MADPTSLSQQRSGDLGDAAVDGLFSGIGAGILMAVYLVLAGLLTGDSPGVMLGRFDASAAASPLTGTLLHLAVSAVYGLVFGIGWSFLRRRLTRFNWLAGIVYGVILFVVGRFLLVPGADSSLLDIPLIHFGIAHIVYGLVLGLLISRQRSHE